MVESMFSIDDLSVSSTPITRQSSTLSFHINDDSAPILESSIKTLDSIISNQTKALQYLTGQYRFSEFSIAEMKKSLRILNNSLRLGGKIVISGMGKSFKIASKTVATFNSLRMHAALLHPSEALHGDLGMLRSDHKDALIIISASGNSPELLTMMEHISDTVPIILMTCTKSSVLSRHEKVNSIMLAELPPNLNESLLYGLSAPTISTTLCLTLLDAVAISLSELHINDINIRKSLFAINHPGGAIGMKYKQETGDNGLSLNDKVIVDEIELQVPALASVSIKNADPALETILGDSSYKVELQEYPVQEGETLRLIALYDFIIIRGRNVVLKSNIVRDIFKKFSGQEEPWSEISWRIRASALPYSSDV